jgi:serine/threonine protein kinase
LLHAHAPTPEAAEHPEDAAAGSTNGDETHRPLNLQRQLGLAREAATAVEFLHAQQPPIAHCDLKSANYLLGRDNLLKLADFGDAVVMSSPAAETSHAGTPEWMAPEVMQGIKDSMVRHERRSAASDDRGSGSGSGSGSASPRGSQEAEAEEEEDFGAGGDRARTAAAAGIIDRRQCDIYSLGVVLWEIMARMPPLRTMPRKEVMARVCDTPRRELDEPMPESTPEMYVQCCNSCWGSPAWRPEAREVVEWVKRAARSEMQKETQTPTNRLQV